ncbi:hypothetical protein ABZS79_14625 [Streptomyces griseoloalbus]|uniref:hypothetical protein n=1 Tax=Streptomyces griseoloalbus TaxID=67303 RepID=UPI0033A900CE
MVPGVIVPLVSAIIAGVIAWKAIGPSQKGADATVSAEEREKNKEEEERDKEAGPPVSATVGFPAYYPSRYAFPGQTTDLGVASEFGYGTEGFSKWFSGNGGRAVGLDAVRFTVTPLHKGTVIVQSVRVTDVQCTPTKFDGTAFVPPPIGDGGDEVEPVDVAFDLTEKVPQPRTIKNAQNVGGIDDAGEPVEEVWHLGGRALSKGIYLDGGERPDSRAFDVYFFSGDKDCEFGVELNVTSGDTDDWFPVKLTTEDYRARLAGQATSYRSVVVGVSDTRNELQGPGSPFTPIAVKKERL